MFKLLAIVLSTCAILGGFLFNGFKCLICLSKVSFLGGV